MQTMTAVPVVPSTEATLSAVSSSPSTRLTSLDLFRGVTIAAMILVNSPGNAHPYWPLEHAEWNGWTPTDLIFPFFLYNAVSIDKRSPSSVDPPQNKYGPFHVARALNRNPRTADKIIYKLVTTA